MKAAMVSHLLLSLSLLVVPAASVEQIIHLFEGEGGGCNVLDTTYAGTDLTTGTSCKKVMSDSLSNGKGTVSLKYMEGQDWLTLQVHGECAGIDTDALVMEAHGAESAKIRTGECGEVEVSLYEGSDKSFLFKMYMKISTPMPATSAALATTPAEQPQSSNMVEHTIHTFQGKGEGCTVPDTSYTGTDLITSASCKKVVSYDVKNGKSTVFLKNLGSQKMLKFKFHDTCDDMHAMAVIIEASEAESAKILAGECGEATSYLGDDKGTRNFDVKMYMMITPPMTSAALATTAAPGTAAAAAAIASDQAESINIVMPIVSVVMLLAY